MKKEEKVREKVIIKVEKPAAWVNQIVVIENSNGKDRICLDPKDLNHGSVREHYSLETVEDVAAILQNANVFNILDSASGFHQIKPTEESIWVTTFDTP